MTDRLDPSTYRIDNAMRADALARLRPLPEGAEPNLAETLKAALNRIVVLEAEVKRLEAKPKLDERKALAFDDLVRCVEHSAVGLVEFQFSRGKFSVKCVLADGDELEAPESNFPEQACHNGYEELRDWYGKREEP